MASNSGKRMIMHSCIYRFTFSAIRLLFVFSFPLAICAFLFSCSPSRSIKVSAQKHLNNNPSLAKGHVGVYIIEPSTGKIWFKQQSNQYFIPASNTKLFSLYAGLKFLPERVKGIKLLETDSTLTIFPTGDPTLLHPQFDFQPVLEYLKTTNKKLYGVVPTDSITAYGPGWSWEDYPESFMNERSVFPVYGNQVVFAGSYQNTSSFPKHSTITIRTEKFESDISTESYIKNITRDPHRNDYKISYGSTREKRMVVPFISNPVLSFQLLADTIHKPIEIIPFTSIQKLPLEKTIYSYVWDSLFRHMMHTSDNFFAEQVLLMSTREKLETSNIDSFISQLLQDELNALPQKPIWRDACGLSRYNLFTPESLAYILEKMIHEFGELRIKAILPTGNEGTLKGQFLQETGKIYAKTGSMSHIYSISGFLETKKGKNLIFVVMANNFPGKIAEIRSDIELFISDIIQKN